MKRVAYSGSRAANIGEAGTFEERHSACYVPLEVAVDLDNFFLTSL